MLSNQIIERCSTQYRKVARVFGQIYEKKRHEPGFNYASLEEDFFSHLNAMIAQGIIESQGTISPDNMRHSEIALMVPNRQTQELSLSSKIMRESSTHYRKVARVFGQIYLEDKDKPEFDYATLETRFFNELHGLIQKGMIQHRGLINAHNMGNSEIAWCMPEREITVKEAL